MYLLFDKKEGGKNQAEVLCIDTAGEKVNIDMDLEPQFQNVARYLTGILLRQKKSETRAFIR